MKAKTGSAVAILSNLPMGPNCSETPRNYALSYLWIICQTRLRDMKIEFPSPIAHEQAQGMLTPNMKFYYSNQMSKKCPKIYGKSRPNLVTNATPIASQQARIMLKLEQYNSLPTETGSTWRAETATADSAASISLFLVFSAGDRTPSTPTPGSTPRSSTSSRPPPRGPPTSRSPRLQGPRRPIIKSGKGSNPPHDLT